MATQLCPCGNAGEPSRVCTCSDADILRYRSRLSGPLADRIDMHVTLGAVSAQSLQQTSGGERSDVIRQRVEDARGVQRVRYANAGVVSATCNAHAPGRWLLLHGGLAADARRLLATAMDSLKLSARGYHRVLRVARTIADLDRSDSVEARHVAEALRYRPA